MKVEDLINNLKELNPETEIKFLSLNKASLENMKRLKSLLRTSPKKPIVWKFFLDKVYLLSLDVII